MIKKPGLSASNQGLDSTLTMSNIRVKGRLALFSDTLTLFLKSLDKDSFARVPETIRTWYSSEPEGWFGLGPSEQKTRFRLRRLVKVCFSVACKVTACNIKRSAKARTTLKWLLRHGITSVLPHGRQTGAMITSLAPSPLSSRQSAKAEIGFL